MVEARVVQDVQRPYYALVPGVHGVVAGHVYEVEADLLQRIGQIVRHVEERIARPLAVAGEGALKAAQGVVCLLDVVRHVLEDGRVVVAAVGLQRLVVERGVHD